MTLTGDIPPVQRENCKTHDTREAWLNAAIAECDRLLFKPRDLEVPTRLRASCGLCGGKYIGLCFDPECADDKATHIFIDPRLAEPIEVLAALIHEMVHATVGLECKHKGKFLKVIRDLGLEGKPTSTHVAEGTELHGICMEMAVTLGDYPHSPLRRKVKETKRHAWVSFISSSNEDFIVRANKNTVRELGPPKDYNGEDMVPKNPEDMEDDGEDPQPE